MVPYLVVFLVSCIFSRIDAFFQVKHMKKTALIFAFFSILVPCIFAGARDIGIGTDTVVYAQPLWNVVQHGYDSMSALLASSYSSNFGQVTVLLYFFLSKVADNVFWPLFFTELICVLPVYVLIRKSAIKPNLKWLALFIFYCLFFCYTLNIMRQMMAVCILFWGFQYLQRGKNITYLLLVILVTLFIHKTAILALMIWLIYITCTKKSINLFNLLSKNEVRVTSSNKLNKWLYRKRHIFLFVYLISTIAVLFLAKYFVLILSTLKSSYSYQLEHMLDSFNLCLAPLLLMLCYVLPCVVIYRNLVKRNTEIRFLMFTAIIAIILWQLQGVSSELYRVSLYFWFFSIYLIPLVIQGIKEKYTRLTYELYYLFLSFGNWIYYFVICGAGEVIPYTSKLLGIG